MIIYNVTIKVKESLHPLWLQWLRETHIPEVMATGCFTAWRVLRLLEVDDGDGPTYAIQYETESKAMYNLYIEKHAPEMRRRSFEKWADGFIAFRSVMQIVD